MPPRNLYLKQKFLLHKLNNFIPTKVQIIFVKDIFKFIWYLFSKDENYNWIKRNKYYIS
jgi:hypothetical protein